MSAEIVPFPLARKSRVFASFREFSRFVFPDPLWVLEDDSHTEFSPDDAAAVTEYFRRLGVQVDTTGPYTSMHLGWAYLQSKVVSRCVYLEDNPRIYDALTENWPKARQEYAMAVFEGDDAKAAQLLPQTSFWFELQEKMRTPGGCALKEA